MLAKNNKIYHGLLRNEIQKARKKIEKEDKEYAIQNLVYDLLDSRKRRPSIEEVNVILSIFREDNPLFYPEFTPEQIVLRLDEDYGFEIDIEHVIMFRGH